MNLLKNNTCDRNSPDDFSDLEAAVKIDEENFYLVTARSCVVLIEKAKV